MHAAAVPLLFVLAAGKLAGVLGATGQGLAADAPWATAYLGPGPWGSLAADVASQPAQVFEALLVAAAIGILILASRFEVIARRDGGALFAAVGLWALARFVVAFTWRDPAILGPLRIDQVLSLLLIGLSVIGLVERRRAPFRTAGWSEADLEPEPAE
jgi:prolipoprotein diacylglyceryltransferase